jgi:hypothetical protein
VEYVNDRKVEGIVDKYRKEIVPFEYDEIFYNKCMNSATRSSYNTADFTPG